MDKKVNLTDIKKFSEKFNKNKHNILARNAVTHNTFNKVALNTKITQSITPIFSNKIETDTEATNQKRTGRSWMFAFLNTLRIPVIEKYNLDDDYEASFSGKYSFEFSQSYLMFYDKLEKANLFLWNIYKTKKEKVDSRIIQQLLKDPISDGGVAYMMINLVEKYGLLPKNKMKDTVQGSNSKDLGIILEKKLKEYAINIRKSKYKKIDTYIKSCLEEIYNILVIFLGEPPKNFVWEYYIKEDSKKSKKRSKKRSKKKGTSSKYKRTTRLTPLQFYNKVAPFKLNNLVTLIHSPMKSMPYYKRYTVNYAGNQVDGRRASFINVPIQMIKDISELSIKYKNPVWFGQDVGKYSNSKMGIMDTELYNYKNVLGCDVGLTKEERLEYNDGNATHAMVLRGFNKIGKKIDKWLVENSWGKKSGINGNLIMSDRWFSEHVYMISVNKKYLPKKVLETMKQKPIVLPPWNPFGFVLY